MAALALLVAGIVWRQWGAHIELKGSILKVRSQPLDENSTAVVVDFRFRNPADYPFVVRKVEVRLEDGSGGMAEGMVIAESDAQRLFEYFPVLGQKYNPTLLMRDRVQPKESADRMVAVRFELPQALVEARRKLVVRVEEVDGAVSELVQE